MAAKPLSDYCSFRYEGYNGEDEINAMICLIEKDLSEPYSIYTYRFFLHNWPHLTFNCKLNNSNVIIGTIVGKIQPHKKGKMRGYIGMLAVDSNYRNSGIAQTLVIKLIEEMRKSKAEELVLEAEIENLAALALYRKLGFFRDKYLPRYYFNGSDAFRLKFNLT